MDQATENDSQVVDSDSPAKVAVAISFQDRKGNIARGGRACNKGEDERGNKTVEVPFEWYLVGQIFNTAALIYSMKGRSNLSILLTNIGQVPKK